MGFEDEDYIWKLYYGDFKVKKVKLSFKLGKYILNGEISMYFFIFVNVL